MLAADSPWRYVNCVFRLAQQSRFTERHYWMDVLGTLCLFSTPPGSFPSRVMQWLWSRVILSEHSGSDFVPWVAHWCFSPLWTPLPESVGCVSTSRLGSCQGVLWLLSASRGPGLVRLFGDRDREELAPQRLVWEPGCQGGKARCVYAWTHAFTWGGQRSAPDTFLIHSPLYKTRFHREPRAGQLSWTGRPASPGITLTAPSPWPQWLCLDVSLTLGLSFSAPGVLI